MKQVTKSLLKKGLTLTLSMVMVVGLIMPVSVAAEETESSPTTQSTILEITPPIETVEESQAIEGISQPIAATSVNIGNPIGLNPNPDLGGTQVYFGNFNGGSYANAPMKWIVVASDADTVTLFNAGDVGKRRYDGGFNNGWSGSEICLWLNGTTPGTFLNDAFQAGERNAISAYGTMEIGSYATIDISQLIVLPSVAEVQNNGGWNLTGDSVRAYSNDWWLRSPGASIFSAASVLSLGSIYSSGDGVRFTFLTARPAFKLNLSSVFFTSNATDGKSVPVGSTLTVATAPAGPVKLTLVDQYNADTNPTGQATPSLTVTGNSGRTITFSYSGATPDTTLSAVVIGSDGIVKYYGQLASNITANGTGVTVTVPADFSPTDKIEIFTEKLNGDNQTDFASKTVELTALVFTTQPGSLIKTAGDDATFTVFANGSPAPNLQWQVSLDGGNSWENVLSATSSTLTLTAVTLAMNGNQYRCLASNAVQSGVESAIATLTVNPQVLNGTATISKIAPVVGDVLTASLSGGNNTGTLQYVWRVDGVQVGTDSIYTVTKADLGKAITLTITSDVEPGVIISEATSLVSKKPCPTTPVIPTLLTKTKNSITLQSITGYEYSIDGIQWQTSNVFTGLAPNTIYVFYERIAATEDTLASPTSTGVEIRTVATYTITLSSSPAGAGSVAGFGSFDENTEQTVTATANTGYEFVNWTEKGQAVSQGASYTFTLTADRNLVANFKEKTTPTVTPTPTATPTTKPTVSPTAVPKPIKTGEQGNSSMTFLLIGMLAVTGGILLVVYRKRRRSC